MTPPSRFGRLNLTAILLFFLSLLNIAIAAPLSDSNGNINSTLVARNLKPITQQQYVAYLQKYFKDTDRYLLYTGGSEDQVKAFQAHNKGYYYYDDLFNTHGDRNHPWYKAFDENTQEDDAEASSRAIAAAATKQISVFGAIEYKTAGASSFYTTEEVKVLQDGVNSGRIAHITHMAKGATSTTQVMAEEDGHGKFTWKNGHKEGDKNASGAYGNCKRTGCDKPTVESKKKSTSSAKKTS